MFWYAKHSHSEEDLTSLVDRDMSFVVPLGRNGVDLEFDLPSVAMDLTYSHF